MAPEARSQYACTMKELPDLELMSRVSAGDSEAFEVLVMRHQNRVVGTIAKMLGSPEEAEDLAQQVFVRVWKSAARWKATAQFTTWLLTITRNLVFNEIRRRGRARLVSIDEENEHGPREMPDDRIMTPSEEIDVAELQAKIDEAIQALPEQARMAVILRRYEEMPYEEIAVVLDTTVPAVKSMLFRARTELRARLAGYLKE
jgi:RNA polymerase sigma factor, sigma-70 family